MHGTSCPKPELKSTCLTAKFGSLLYHKETSDFFAFCYPCFFYHAFTNDVGLVQFLYGGFFPHPPYSDFMCSDCVELFSVFCGPTVVIWHVRVQIYSIDEYRGERGELAPLFLIASSEVMLTARRLLHICGRAMHKSSEYIHF